ncbi:Pyridoxine-5'-phosphate oxidase [Orchesella cincta]|uniref:pyridoxal 5'-phosphate synthase n=1 Tax=Orchesella cincta TaxID=48709 RepID=A0A1D2NKJ8_ORCCI|nr:Pyridoxine-5'-phosphate oxidase [Orchesella cincta]
MGSIAAELPTSTKLPSSVSESDADALKYGILEIDLVSKNPMELFKAWYADAHQVPENTYPQAMTLATVRKDGGPSARTVLLRGLDEHGFKMYWDHRSRKTDEIKNDSRGALVFCWTYKDETGTAGGRQVRIEGILEKLTEDDNTDYFNNEPLPAKIRATACHQSRVITDNRDSMLSQIHSLYQKATSGQLELTKPDYWGGFRLVPQMIEFYQGQRDTINDRIRFRKVSETDTPSAADEPGVSVGDDGWVYERLEP